MSIQIRTADEVDVPYLNDIDSHKEWKDWIHPNAAREGRVSLALFDGHPAGYLRNGSFLWDDREPFIQMVHVAAEFRRLGVATQLIGAFIERAETEAPKHFWEGVYSSVDVKNAPSIALHEKLGFTACGEPQILLGQIDQWTLEPVPEILYARPFAVTQ